VSVGHAGRHDPATRTLPDRVPIPAQGEVHSPFLSLPATSLCLLVTNVAASGRRAGMAAAPGRSRCSKRYTRPMLGGSFKMASRHSVVSGAA
jgi:hypothetical protein